VTGQRGCSLAHQGCIAAGAQAAGLVIWVVIRQRAVHRLQQEQAGTYEQTDEFDLASMFRESSRLPSTAAAPHPMPRLPPTLRLPRAALMLMLVSGLTSRLKVKRSTEACSQRNTEEQPHIQPCNKAEWADSTAVSSTSSGLGTWTGQAESQRLCISKGCAAFTCDRVWQPLPS
jgi:hypothetical protein